MKTSITIDDLIANALIELVERKRYRKISFSQLNKYSEAVVANLKAKDIDVYIEINRNTTEEFFDNCSDVFSLKEENGNTFIFLNDNVSTDYLRRYFRINLSLDVLPAFIAENALKALLQI